MFLRFCIWTLISLPFLACGSKKASNFSQDQGRDSLPVPLAAPPSSATFSADDPQSWQPSPKAKLIFSTIDPLSMPWQSSVYQLDLKSKSLTRRLTGESGDPALFSSGGEVLFFNRTFDSQNYRRLLPKADTLQISSQKRFAEGEIGDPYAALYLGNDRLLLAHYTQGRLIIMQQSTGMKLATVDADWDLPPGASLKPKALVPIDKNGKRFIYVVHDALSLQNGQIFANGSQQIFVLEDLEGSVKAVDLHPEQAKVQGIKLQGSFPIVVPFERRDKILLASLCSRFVLSSPVNAAQSCQSTIEEVDIETSAASTLWDLNDAGLYMNGPVSSGPNRSVFFANVERRLGPKSYEKQVVKFNISEQSVSTVYSFMPNSGGFWASLYDEASKTLFVGDTSKDTLGKFVLLSESGEKTELALPGVPYSGVFFTND